MLVKHLKNSNLSLKNNERFKFDVNFYQMPYYWLRFGYLLKILTFIFLVLYLPYTVVLAVLSLITPTFLKSNTVIQIRKKTENFKKCRHYLRILLEKSPDHMLMDYHFYKMSIYLKLASLIT